MTNSHSRTWRIVGQLHLRTCIQGTFTCVRVNVKIAPEFTKPCACCFCNKQPHKEFSPSRNNTLLQRLVNHPNLFAKGNHQKFNQFRGPQLLRETPYGMVHPLSPGPFVAALEVFFKTPPEPFSPEIPPAPWVAGLCSPHPVFVFPNAPATSNQVVQVCFPEIQRAVLVETIATYQRMGCWQGTEAISTQSYETLGASGSSAVRARFGRRSGSSGVVLGTGGGGGGLSFCWSCGVLVCVVLLLVILWRWYSFEVVAAIVETPCVWGCQPEFHDRRLRKAKP